MLHALKASPGFFKASAAGLKRFVVHKSDRPYQPGDHVALNEWTGEQYTGRFTLHRIVYIFSDPEHCKEGFIIMRLEPCAIKTQGEYENETLFPVYGKGVPVYER